MKTNNIPEGMIEIWTIERPEGAGVLIDDIKLTEEEAYDEIIKRNGPWKTTRLVVPYGKPKE